MSEAERHTITGGTGEGSDAGALCTREAPVPAPIHISEVIMAGNWTRPMGVTQFDEPSEDCAEEGTGIPTLAELDAEGDGWFGAAEPCDECLRMRREQAEDDKAFDILRTNFADAVSELDVAKKAVTELENALDRANETIAHQRDTITALSERVLAPRYVSLTIFDGKLCVLRDDGVVRVLAPCGREGVGVWQTMDSPAEDAPGNLFNSLNQRTA